MTKDSKAVDDAIWNEVRQHFDEGETVDIAAAIAFFNYFNIFNNTLQMEPTK